MELVQTRLTRLRIFFYLRCRVRWLPLEEEEITPDRAAAIDRARASLERGEGIPQEDILREFGLDK